MTRAICGVTSRPSGRIFHDGEVPLVQLEEGEVVLADVTCAPRRPSRGPRRQLRRPRPAWHGPWHTTWSPNHARRERRRPGPSEADRARSRPARAAFARYAACFARIHDGYPSPLISRGVEHLTVLDRWSCPRQTNRVRDRRLRSGNRDGFAGPQAVDSMGGEPLS